MLPVGKRRSRVAYLACLVVVITLGLASRRYGADLPGFVARYAGDTLWALMVFLGFSVIAPALRVSSRAALALLVSYAVEISQLYHAPWIDSVRGSTIGGLVLGFGFLWSDIVCYTVGIAAGAATESILCGRTRDHGLAADG